MESKKKTYIFRQYVFCYFSSSHLSCPWRCMKPSFDSPAKFVERNLTLLTSEVTDDVTSQVKVRIPTFGTCSQWARVINGSWNDEIIQLQAFFRGTVERTFRKWLDNGNKGTVLLVTQYNAKENLNYVTLTNKYYALNQNLSESTKRVWKKAMTTWPKSISQQATIPHKTIRQLVRWHSYVPLIFLLGCRIKVMIDQIELVTSCKANEK